jgi:hypothetical protein
MRVNIHTARLWVYPPGSACQPPPKGQDLSSPPTGTEPRRCPAE